MSKITYNNSNAFKNRISNKNNNHIFNNIKKEECIDIYENIKNKKTIYNPNTGRKLNYDSPITQKILQECYKKYKMKKLPDVIDPRNLFGNKTPPALSPKSPQVLKQINLKHLLNNLRLQVQKLKNNHHPILYYLKNMFYWIGLIQIN